MFFTSVPKVGGLEVLPELRDPGVGGRGEAVPLVETADQAADRRVVAEDADQQQARQQHRQHRPVAVTPPGQAPGQLVLGAHERYVHGMILGVSPGRCYAVMNRYLSEIHFGRLR